MDAEEWAEISPDVDTSQLWKYRLSIQDHIMDVARAGIAFSDAVAAFERDPSPETYSACENAEYDFRWELGDKDFSGSEGSPVEQMEGWSIAPMSAEYRAKCEELAARMFAEGSPLIEQLHNLGQ